MNGTILNLGGVDPAKLRAGSVFTLLRGHAERAEVPAVWHYGTLTDKDVYLGQCFGRAFSWVQAHYTRMSVRSAEPCAITGAQLVHGALQATEPCGTSGWFWHAWVELPGDVVFDGVVQQFYTRASYVALTRAEALAAYDWPAAKWRREHRRHVGPWYFAEASALRRALGRHDGKDVGLPCNGCGEAWPCPTTDLIHDVIRLQGASSGVSKSLQQLLRIGELEDVVPALQRAGLADLAARLIQHLEPLPS